MPDYRLYCLDKQGHILHPHDFEAADDQASLVLANNREHPEQDCEIWQAQRKIAKLSARPAT